MIMYPPTNHTISPRVIRSIRERVPCRLNAHRLEGGGWIIGYGQQASALPGLRISHFQAESLLRNDLYYCEAMVRLHVDRSISQGLYDGVVDAIFDAGSAAVLRSCLFNVINEHSISAVVSQIRELQSQSRFGRLSALTGLNDRIGWILND